MIYIYRHNYNLLAYYIKKKRLQFVLLCHEGEGPVPMALVLTVLFFIIVHKPHHFTSMITIHQRLMLVLKIMFLYECQFGMTNNIFAIITNLNPLLHYSVILYNTYCQLHVICKILTATFVTSISLFKSKCIINF